MILSSTSPPALPPPPPPPDVFNKFFPESLPVLYDTKPEEQDSSGPCLSSPPYERISYEEDTESDSSDIYEKPQADHEDSDSELNDSQPYTYIPTTNVSGQVSLKPYFLSPAAIQRSISIHAITSPSVDYLKLHPQQGYSPDPTNDQLQLLIKQMQHMQEMLTEMRSTYVQHISQPPPPPPIHTGHRSMSDSSSPENTSDTATGLAHRSMSDSSSQHASKCFSTTSDCANAAKSEANETATCKDSESDSTQISGAIKHPDPETQAINQMKEVFRKLW